MLNNTLSRLARIRKNLEELSLDALFITNQFNIAYLTNFAGLSPSEREAYVLVTKNNAYLFLFSTYMGLIKKINGFKILSITSSKGITSHLEEIIKKEELKTIGFEKDNLTVSELANLRNKLKIIFKATSNLIEDLRLIKEEKELGDIKKAAQITDRVFDFIKKRIKRGVTEKDLALELEFFIKKHADDVAFPPIVAFNHNAAIPHYLSTEDQKLKTNSLILLDFGAKVGGYCSDMTRVVFFGKPKNEWVKIYNTVLEAQKKVLKKFKAGLKVGILDQIARQYIINNGYPEYPHGLGHGVGLAIHEAPRLRKESTEILKENMVVTVEPAIYLQGECGVRIEDLVVLKRYGIEILSKSSKEITIV